MIRQAYIPSARKHAKLCPIPKPGKPKDRASYRPISLLNTLSKLSAKIIHRRLLEFLEDVKLINNILFGFTASIVPRIKFPE